MAPLSPEVFVTTIISISVAFIGSQGFWNWLSAKRDRSSEIIDKLHKLQEAVDAMQYEAEKNEADTARVRIIRFNDDLIAKRRHSKESFDLVLADVDDYEEYCREHPEYKNNKTIMSVENIKRIYQKCEAENDFLTSKEA